MRMDKAQDQKLIFTPPANIDGERTGRVVPREHLPRLIDASMNGTIRLQSVCRAPGSFGLTAPTRTAASAIPRRP